jgi:ADP-heptose:LPS heptosyltransferase
VIVGGAPEEVTGIEKLMKNRALTVTGVTDPLKLAALLKRLDLLVSNDTGPMHLAAAVDTAVVTLFGPTNPDRTGPYGEKHTVIRAAVNCSPCYRRRCDRDELCMSTISVEKVKEAVENSLKHKA